MKIIINILAVASLLILTVTSCNDFKKNLSERSEPNKFISIEDSIGLDLDKVWRTRKPGAFFQDSSIYVNSKNDTCKLIINSAFTINNRTYYEYILSKKHKILFKKYIRQEEDTLFSLCIADDTSCITENKWIVFGDTTEDYLYFNRLLRGKSICVTFDRTNFYKTNSIKKFNLSYYGYLPADFAVSHSTYKKSEYLCEFVFEKKMGLMAIRLANNNKYDYYYLGFK